MVRRGEAGRGEARLGEARGEGEVGVTYVVGQRKREEVGDDIEAI